MNRRLCGSRWLLLVPTTVLLPMTPVMAGGVSAGPPTCHGLRATIVGTPGADTIRGTSGDDIIVAGSGDDTIKAGRGGDLVCAGDGDDIVDSGLGKDRMYGEPGDDRLLGAGSLHDSAIGGSDDDVIDRVRSVIFRSAPGGVDVDLAAGTAHSPDTGHDTLIHVFNIVGSRFADHLDGDGTSNDIAGLGGGDEIHARGGDDTILVGLGDSVDGGEGLDFADFSGRFPRSGRRLTRVEFDLAAETLVTHRGDVSGIGGISSIEMVYGTNGDDSLYGDDDSNSLWGWAGADDVRGRGGDDYLSTGYGGRVDGGPGVDSCSASYVVNCEQ